MIHQVISDGFYYVIDLKPEIVNPDKNGNRLISKISECPLDPGGILHCKIPWIDFELMGVKFAVQMHNAEYSYKRIVDSREDFDDHTKFKLWWHTFVVTPELCDAILSKLKEMAFSSEAAHAELDARESLMGVESDTNGFVTFRGRTPKEIEKRLRDIGFLDSTDGPFPTHPEI